MERDPLLKMERENVLADSLTDQVEIEGIMFGIFQQYVTAVVENKMSNFVPTLKFNHFLS